MEVIEMLGDVLGLKPLRDVTFVELERYVQKAEHVNSSYLSSPVYRSIAELEGYGVNPEVEDLLKRAEAVLEREGEFFPDMEGTLDALEKGRIPASWNCVFDLTLQAVCNHSVCANRVKNCPDDAEFQQALVKAEDWRTRAERLLETELGKNRDKNLEKIAKLEQEVQDSEREGKMLSHETYLTLATKAKSGRPEDVALLRRAESVWERDGLFFRDLAGTINALERGRIELSDLQLYALYLQAGCNLSAVTLNDRAKRLFAEGMARERARENERDHEGDLSSPHS
jgi:hypothetical protein